MVPIAQSENDEVIADNVNQDDGNDRLTVPANKIGIQGWRKWCLFVLLMFLLILVMTNLALTLWILSVMRIHKDGMGQMRIIPGGIQLSGDAIFQDSLIASTIKSATDRPLSIDSFDNFTIRTLDDASIKSQIFLDHNKLECHTNEFIIKDVDGNKLFASNPDEILFGTDSLRITGEGGAIFKSSVSTPLVRAETGHHLILESLTRSLSVIASKKISMQSNDIEAVSYKNIKLKSTDGAIMLDSSNVQMKNLHRAIPDWHNAKIRPKKRPMVYQLCACENGRLFLANSRGICTTHDSNYICN